jgi:hypothetical protein
MSKSIEMQRAELTEACAKVRRQIEIASSPANALPLIGTMIENRSEIAELEFELSQLEGALASLGLENI